MKLSVLSLGVHIAHVKHVVDSTVMKPQSLFKNSLQIE